MQINVKPMEGADHEPLTRFLTLDSPLNLYLLGFLEQGDRVRHSQIWIARRGRTLIGALLRTGTAWMPGLPLPLWVPALSHIDCAPHFIRVMEQFPDSHIVSGPLSIAEALVAGLPERVIEEGGQLSFETLRRLHLPPGLPQVGRASGGDFNRVAALHAEGKAGRADWVRRLESTPRRVWFGANEAGEVIASCHTHLETGTHAMVGGVFTRTDARGRGWASACVAGLCGELLQEGKIPCLYHEGEVDRNLYARLGFQAHGRWFMSRIAPSPN